MGGEGARDRALRMALMGFDDDEEVLDAPPPPLELWGVAPELPARARPCYVWSAECEPLNVRGPGVEYLDAVVAEEVFAPAIPQRHPVWGVSRFDNIVSASRAPTILYQVPYDDGWGKRWGVAPQAAARQLLFDELVCRRARVPMFPPDEVADTDGWLQHDITRGVMHEDVVAALVARARNLVLFELGSLRFPEPWDILNVSFDRLTHSGINVEIKCPRVLSEGLGPYEAQVRMQEAWLRVRHGGQAPPPSYFVQLRTRKYLDCLWYPWRDPKLTVAQNVARLCDLVSRMPPRAAEDLLWVQRPPPAPEWLAENYDELARFDMSVRRYRARHGITLATYAELNGVAIPPHEVCEPAIEY
jgi:hypothetical protein